MGTKAEPKERQAKQQAVESPGKDDVHEQRERDQPAEGAVRHTQPKVHPRDRGTQP